MNRSSEALADLEDARDNVRRFEKGLGWAVFTLVTCAVLIIGGAAVTDLLPFVGPAGVAAIVVGSVGILPTLLFGAVWLYSGMEDQLYQDRHRAQRKYDRALSDEAAKMTGGAS